MSREELRRAVLEALASVAPELEPDSLRADVPLREQLDLDSFDFLQCLVALDKRLSLPIPEADYGRLTTLEACVDYLQERLAARGR